MLQSQVESRLLPFVEKPLRYVGNELNIIRKDLSAVNLRGVLCFPDIYDVGMSHFGIQILYHIVNRHPSWALGRCFHPWPDAEEIMRREEIPLYDLEYVQPLSRADWVGFSLQYELQYTNIINMLDLGGIAIRSADRDDKAPLVIAGGPCGGNPEPLAEFVDAFVVGDGETAIVQLCTALEKAKQENATRADALRSLSGIRGVYVPSLCLAEKIGVFVVPACGSVHSPAKEESLSDDFYPERPLVPLIQTVHHRLAVEVMRGCTRGCRFCSAGTYYRPVRERDVDCIHRQITRGIGATGWRDVGLLSLSTADYSGLSELLQTARALKDDSRVSLSLPSTRIDALTEQQFGALASISNQSSFTIAPEAGSERLRAVINKGFTDEQVYTTAQMLLGKRVQTLKLYFMIGLPTETDEDIDALVDMVNRIAGMARGAGGRRQVNVAVSPFSPKPHTPFQWEALDSVESLTRKAQRIKQALRSKKNVKVSYRDPKTTMLETVLARGDRTVGALVVSAWKAGARLDGWDEHFRKDLWDLAAESLGLDLSVFTGAIPLDQPLPWGAVSTGVSEEYLKSEHEKSLLAQTTGDCRSGDCFACGACDDPLAGLATVAKPLPEQRFGRSARREQPRPGQFFYRLRYRKGREVRFLGHRDMVNIIQRAFVAAEVPVEYSQGFSPHPRMGFGPPLALAAMGERELFDIITSRPIDSLWEKANAWLPESLHLDQCTQARMKPAAVSAEMSAARFRFEPLEPLGKGTLAGKIEEFVAREELIVEIRRKDRVSQVDIRPLVVGAGVAEHDGTECIDALLRALPGSTCRPADFIAALIPELSTKDFLVTRTACLGGADGAWVDLGEV